MLIIFFSNVFFMLFCHFHSILCFVYFVRGYIPFNDCYIFFSRLFSLVLSFKDTMKKKERTKKKQYGYRFSWFSVKPCMAVCLLHIMENVQINSFVPKLKTVTGNSTNTTTTRVRTHTHDLTLSSCHKLVQRKETVSLVRLKALRKWMHMVLLYLTCTQSHGQRMISYHNSTDVKTR